MDLSKVANRSFLNERLSKNQRFGQVFSPNVPAHRVLALCPEVSDLREVVFIGDFMSINDSGFDLETMLLIFRFILYVQERVWPVVWKSFVIIVVTIRSIAECWMHDWTLRSVDRNRSEICAQTEVRKRKKI